MNNPEMCTTFGCTPSELDDLKSGIKHLMLTYQINGRPLIEQLPSEVDPDGVIYERLWQRLAETDPTARTLLNGDRLMVVDSTFERTAKRAKKKICRDWITEARRDRSTGKKQLSKRKRSSSPAPESPRLSSSPAPAASPRSSASSPSWASGSRAVPDLREYHEKYLRKKSKKSVGRPYPARLQPAVEDSLFVEDTVLRRPNSMFADRQTPSPDPRLRRDKRRASKRIRIDDSQRRDSSSEETSADTSFDAEMSAYFEAMSAVQSENNKSGDESRPIDLTQSETRAPPPETKRTPLSRSALDTFQAATTPSREQSYNSGPPASLGVSPGDSDQACSEQSHFDLPTQVSEATTRYANELNAIVARLDRRMARREDAMERRLLRRLQAMLAERDQRFERLRYMVEGHGERA